MSRWFRRLRCTDDSNVQMCQIPGWSFRYPGRATYHIVEESGTRPKKRPSWQSRAATLERKQRAVDSARKQS